LAAGDADKFRRTAHSLKSNGLTFGATALAASARELELGGLALARETGAGRLDALGAEYSRVASALAELARA
jgi:HPt (histidine-containing phosphotransfer) domain-containing protein